MRNIRCIVLAAIFSVPLTFADDMQQNMSPDSRPCGSIAKACKAAGFARGEEPNKKFWQDCMKPIILGQTVSSVTVDPATVESCRTDKIRELKEQLDEFQKASSKQTD